MPRTLSITTRCLALAALLLAAAGSTWAEEGSHRLAPGFKFRPSASRVVVLPADMELFSISAGGVLEPRADWTAAAQKHFRSALAARKDLGAGRITLAESDAEPFAEITALHRAVADAVLIHHTGGLDLPTKGGKLDWTLGEEAMRPLREKTGADYALFFLVRDTYASNERKAAIVAMALMGGIMTAGSQAGFASLVDLRSGRIVWFHELDRLWGDLREADPAAETLDALLKDFPALQPARSQP